ncbi:hypothetical protein N656DRAFT_643061 [Canariomyces notabilis]|uniref:Clr5 domain-containing protein n=1 Tax=Canariomyces notabilis TaxID=2074819 RepID=A0AAN6YTH8_9PEZI|nr:hypothetical protein N656DRAFT_643061 [Canariomyces arenarius]
MQREEERPPAPLDWDKHKDEILELYVSQNKKLPDVKKHMSLTHNFKVMSGPTLVMNSNAAPNRASRPSCVFMAGHYPWRVLVAGLLVPERLNLGQQHNLRHVSLRVVIQC